MLLNKYLLNNAHRYASKWLVLAIDVVIVAISFTLSYVIRFNLSFNFDVDQLLIQLPVVMVISAVSFLMVGSFKGVIRHTGIRDVYNLFNAVCLFSILTIFMVIMVKETEIIDTFTIPLSIIVIHSLISFLALTSSRYAFKTMYYEMFRQIQVVRNVLIFGAGESGVLTFNALTTHTGSNTKVLGYIDNDKKKIGKSINGLPVFSRDNINKYFIKSKNISEIIFSIHKIDSKKLNVLVEDLMELGVKIKIVPPVDNWINGELKVSQIKPIQIEDLLNRSQIKIEKSKISNELRDKVILVTGGAGSIGSEIVRQIAKYNYKSLIIIDQAESALYDLQQELKQNGFHNFVPIVADIRDRNKMSDYFQQFAPDVIFHAAAYKHVPLMEYNVYEAVKINVMGTKNIVDLAVKYKVSKFVFVSTDKAVNPTNVMGATKRIAEMYISCKQKEGKTKFITTRFGNVLGSNGSVIPLFRKQIEKGGPLTVTHKDITRYFMTIPEASQLVLEAGAMGSGGEIFIFDMGESVKIFDLAKNMIKLSGLNYPTDIDIKITGLRPGEKLYEELLANGENMLPTYHKKIMISKVRDIDYHKVTSKIDELCLANLFADARQVVKCMKEIVPEYISENSELSKLDSVSKIVTINPSKNQVLQS